MFIRGERLKTPGDAIKRDPGVSVSTFRADTKPQADRRLSVRATSAVISETAIEIIITSAKAPE